MTRARLLRLRRMRMICESLAGTGSTDGQRRHLASSVRCATLVATAGESAGKSASRVCIHYAVCAMRVQSTRDLIRNRRAGAARACGITHPEYANFPIAVIDVPRRNL